MRLTDGSATKLVDYTYEPYGQTSSDAAASNAFKYTGREDDGGALYYYRARFYDTGLKRFISEDAIGIKGGDNLYAYVANNPISYTDPDGLRKRGGTPKWSGGNTNFWDALADGLAPDNVNFGNPLPGWPKEPQEKYLCDWECPKNPYQCSIGDPSSNGGGGSTLSDLPSLRGLVPPAQGCVYRCIPGPFFTPAP